MLAAMANRRDYYFGQLVTDTELDAGFDGIEQAVFNVVADFGLSGVDSGLAVVQHSPSPNLSVDVASGVGYDPLGQRCQVPSTQTVDVSQDFNAVTTAVSTPGNSKILSLFIEFKRSLSDTRTDGNNDTISFVQNESFGFRLVQGTEAPSPVAPALDGTRVLLCDMTLAYGASTIVNGNISTTRRQDVFVRTGATNTMRRGKVKDAVADLTDWSNTAATALAALIAPGPTTLLQAASIAALKAITSRPTNAVCAVPEFGIFVYVPASTDTTDDRFVVTPTDVGGGAGRWITIAPTLRNTAGGSNTAFGLVQSDGSGRVPAQKVNNGVMDVFQVKKTAETGTTSTTYVDVAQMTASFSNCLVGDVITVVMRVITLIDSSSHISSFILRVTEGDATEADISESLFTTSSTLAITGLIVCSYTVAHAGTVTIRARHKTSNAASNSYAEPLMVMNFVRYRP